ncbi:hypothetical protein GOE05_29955 [Sinorhizobium medicae]|nr:hypothetical protein [Sinorhizobium medicae]MQW01908.1 hypothetical protein [Sinorhizobium medicae]
MLTVLRCALLKQNQQLSYQELVFNLEDSASSRAFARLLWSWRLDRPEFCGVADFIS